MGKGCIRMLMELSIQGNGRMISRRDKARRCGLMGLSMWGSIIRVKNRGGAFFFGLMGLNLKDHLLIVICKFIFYILIKIWRWYLFVV
jgi:hypothetical protein